MPKLTYTKDATGKSTDVFIRNTSVTTSISGLTGLTSGSLSCIFHRFGSVATQLTLTSLVSITSAHTGGGFIEVSANGMPGVYRLDLADTMLSTGADFVSVVLNGAVNMEIVPLEIELVDAAAQANVVQWSGSAVNALSAGRVDVTVGEVQPGLVPTSGQVATQVWATVIEGTFTAIQSMRLQNAAMAGLASGLDVLAPVYRDLSNAKNRISASSTVSGNRTAIVYDVT